MPKSFECRHTVRFPLRYKSETPTADAVGCARIVSGKGLYYILLIFTPRGIKIETFRYFDRISF